jgi:hypothetical protein
MRSAFITSTPVPRRSETGQNNPRQRHFKMGGASRVLNAPPSKCGCRRNGNPSRSDGPRAVQPLTITGNRFAFDNAGFAPASGTVFVAGTNTVLRLNWASNQAEYPAVLYTVLGRFATSGAGSTFVIPGGTTAKTLE